MRRITWALAVVTSFVLLLAGCGDKNAEDVVRDLDHMVNKMDSYQGIGSMVLHSGEQPQEYQIEVWYQKPHYYRIQLTNEERNITQIVLKNDNGVFILTPNLKKSYRFQSDWPDNQGQVYLYQTLIKSIVADKDRAFAADKDAYVFDVKANYTNSTLARQKIWLTKDGYEPKHIEVLDQDAKKVVAVDFSHFEFGKKFETNSFEMEHNMTSWHLQSLPVMSQLGEDEEAGLEEATGDFGIIEPAYIPEDVHMQDISEMQLGGQRAVLLRYGGDVYNYSLLETRPRDREVMGSNGTIVDLGFAMGVLSGDDSKTLTWLHEGVEFNLSTATLPLDEMVRIAQSVQGEIGK